MVKRTNTKEKAHTVEREDGVVRRYSYDGTLLAVDMAFTGEDTKGEPYNRIEFQVKISGASLVDILEEMPVETKLHLAHNLPGVAKTIDILGLDESNYIGEGELMDYVLNQLGCNSMDELQKLDRRAYELVKEIPDAEEAFKDDKEASGKRK